MSKTRRLSHSTANMADRPKNPSSQKGHGGKGKHATTAFSSTSHEGSSISAVPTQHPPPPVLSPRTSLQMAAAGHAQVVPPAQKVAILRLRRPSDVPTSTGSTKSGEKHRVNHACESCRQRKTKCSGERPICKHCEDFRIVCVYSDGKRDRVKK